MASFTALRNEVFSKEHRRQQYAEKVLGLNAYERHKLFIKDYQQFYGGGTATTSSAVGQKQEQLLHHRLPIKTDNDTLRETYRFIRSDEDDAERSWEQRLAKRYHDKLFKEYCIADMSRYKVSKIGMRWRTEKEVISGKGQFECANRKCARREGLRSYEVNFAYIEAGESKQALVKLRVCPKCSFKLNYRKEKELERKLRRDARKRRKRSTRVAEKSSSSSRKKKKKTSGKRSGEEKSREEDERSDDEEESVEEESSDGDRSEEEEDYDDDGSDDDASQDLKGVRHLRKSKSKDNDRAGSDGGRLQGTVGNKDREFEPFFKDMFL